MIGAKGFDVEVVADLGGLENFMDGLVRRQLPFATAAALTETVKAAETAAKKRMRSEFKLRSGWAEGGVRRKHANKKDWPNVTAVVGDIGDGKPKFKHWSRIFGLHEMGGVRRGRGGHRLAIPSRAVTRNAAGGITKANRPRGQLARGKAFIQGRRIRRKAKGSRKASTQGNRLTTLFFLRDEVRIRRRFGFRKTVEREANRVLAREFDKSLAVALKSARGRRGRFTSQQGRAVFLKARKALA